MNKYQKHSKARLRDNLVDPLAVYREPAETIAAMHKDTLEARQQAIGRVFGVSRKMFEILCESELSAEERQTALQFLTTLQNRFGER